MAIDRGRAEVMLPGMLHSDVAERWKRKRREL